MSELSATVTDVITTFHHVSGALFLAINTSVLLLIVFDNDSRGGLYRKYLISLQLSSTVMDIFCNLYAPILLVNCTLVYSDSWIARFIDFGTFAAIETLIFGVVANSYCACVYYRRNAVLPPGSRFCYVGWRRLLLFTLLQTFAIIDTTAFLILTKIAQTDVKKITSVLNWVTGKSSYIFFYGSDAFFVCGAVTISYYLCMAAVLAAMIGQVLIELNHGMRNASTATKRYQKRAVVSLVFQGLIPKVIYIAPMGVMTVLYVNTMSLGLEAAAMSKSTSTASALVFSVITMHTVLHSLTILACSPSYRKTLSDCVRLRWRKKSHRSSVGGISTMHFVQSAMPIDK